VKGPRETLRRPRTPESPAAGRPASAAAEPPRPEEPVLRRADQIGRRHGKAAVHWQVGDSGGGAALAFYQDLLRGIAEGDLEVTGLYQVPGLTARRDTSARDDYDRSSLAADLGLAPGDPVLDDAAGAYLAAAREEFWLEAARLARRRLAAERA